MYDTSEASMPQMIVSALASSDQSGLHHRIQSFECTRGSQALQHQGAMSHSIATLVKKQINVNVVWNYSVDLTVPHFIGSSKTW